MRQYESLSVRKAKKSESIASYNKKDTSLSRFSSRENKAKGFKIDKWNDEEKLQLGEKRVLHKAVSEKKKIPTLLRRVHTKPHGSAGRPATLTRNEERCGSMNRGSPKGCNVYRAQTMTKSVGRSSNAKRIEISAPPGVITKLSQKKKGTLKKSATCELQGDAKNGNKQQVQMGSENPRENYHMEVLNKTECSQKYPPNVLTANIRGAKGITFQNAQIPAWASKTNESDKITGTRANRANRANSVTYKFAEFAKGMEKAAPKNSYSKYLEAIFRPPQMASLSYRAEEHFTKHGLSSSSDANGRGEPGAKHERRGSHVEGASPNKLISHFAHHHHAQVYPQNHSFVENSRENYARGGDNPFASRKDKSGYIPMWDINSHKIISTDFLLKEKGKRSLTERKNNQHTQKEITAKEHLPSSVSEKEDAKFRAYKANTADLGMKKKSPKPEMHINALPPNETTPLEAPVKKVQNFEHEKGGLKKDHPFSHTLSSTNYHPINCANRSNYNETRLCENRSFTDIMFRGGTKKEGNLNADGGGPSKANYKLEEPTMVNHTNGGNNANCVEQPKWVNIPYIQKKSSHNNGDIIHANGSTQIGTSLQSDNNPPFTYNNLTHDISNHKLPRRNGNVHLRSVTNTNECFKRSAMDEDKQSRNYLSESKWQSGYMWTDVSGRQGGARPEVHHFSRGDQIRSNLTAELVSHGGGPSTVETRRDLLATAACRPSESPCLSGSSAGLPNLSRPNLTSPNLNRPNLSNPNMSSPNLANPSLAHLHPSQRSHPEYASGIPHPFDLSKMALKENLPICSTKMTKAIPGGPPQISRADEVSQHTYSVLSGPINTTTNSLQAFKKIYIDHSMSEIKHVDGYVLRERGPNVDSGVSTCISQGSATTVEKMGMERFLKCDQKATSLKNEKMLSEMPAGECVPSMKGYFPNRVLPDLGGKSRQLSGHLYVEGLPTKPTFVGDPSVDGPPADNPKRIDMAVHPNGTLNNFAVKNKQGQKSHDENVNTVKQAPRQGQLTSDPLYNPPLRNQFMSASNTRVMPNGPVRHNSNVFFPPPACRGVPKNPLGNNASFSISGIAKDGAVAGGSFESKAGKGPRPSSTVKAAPEKYLTNVRTMLSSKRVDGAAPISGKQVDGATLPLLSNSTDRSALQNHPPGKTQSRARGNPQEGATPPCEAGTTLTDLNATKEIPNRSGLPVCKSISNSDIYNYLRNKHPKDLAHFHRTVSYRNQSLKKEKSLTVVSQKGGANAVSSSIAKAKLLDGANAVSSLSAKAKFLEDAKTREQLLDAAFEADSKHTVKKAVVIGCNYMREAEGERLYGAVNDAYIFSRVLVKYFDFKPENVLLLTDSLPSNAYIHDDFDINKKKYIRQGASQNRTKEEERKKKKNLFHLFNTSSIGGYQKNGADREKCNSCKNFAIKNVDISSEGINLQLWPTRINILKAVNWLVRDSVPLGSYVFYFAGKSVQVDNMSGWEGEGYDEAFLCSDPFNRVQEQNVLTAIQLKDLLLSINASAQMTIVLDCSGCQTILDPAGTENSLSYIKGCKQKGIWPITNPTNKVHKAIYDVTIMNNASMKKYFCKSRYHQMIEVESTAAMIDPLLQSISSLPIAPKAYCFCAATWEQISIEGLFPLMEFARVTQIKGVDTVDHTGGNKKGCKKKGGGEGQTGGEVPHQPGEHSAKKSAYEKNFSFSLNVVKMFFNSSGAAGSSGNERARGASSLGGPQENAHMGESGKSGKSGEHGEQGNHGNHSDRSEDAAYSEEEEENDCLLVSHGVFTYCLVEAIIEFKDSQLKSNILERKNQPLLPMTLKNLIMLVQKKVENVKNEKLKKLNQKPEFTIHPGANANSTNYFVHYCKNIQFQNYKFNFINSDLSPFLNVNKAWEEIHRNTLRSRKSLSVTSTLINSASSKYFSETNGQMKSCYSMRY
ncbi:metacaspase-3, putative [Plasmodium vivax]|uniref:Metacaspase-3, putative n=1 Tax=Plasmodium vivax TaxID=5855 RepID=A0A565A0W1_PLAVI|nr:metacaspase-3, putative [Plasmodium vivax]